MHQSIHRNAVLFKLFLNEPLGGDLRSLPEAIALARQCPNVKFILNHLGAPEVKAGRLDPWRQHIRDLAALPNVWGKMSSAATPFNSPDWKPDQLKPYIAHVLECFGFQRTAYGSDWPVMLAASTCPRWIETLLWAVDGCSESELRALFRNTATTFYRCASRQV